MQTVLIKRIDMRLCSFDLSWNFVVYLHTVARFNKTILLCWKSRIISSYEGDFSWRRRFFLVKYCVSSTHLNMLISRKISLYHIINTMILSGKLHHIILSANTDTDWCHVRQYKFKWIQYTMMRFIVFYVIWYDNILQ